MVTRSLMSGRDAPEALKQSPSDSSTSLIIPTRQRPTLLMRALASVAKQTVAPLEIIVVVDGADDPTIHALRALTDPSVRVLALKEPHGVSYARNWAIRQARGKWVAFLDDDDEWLPNKLERQLLTACESPWEYPIVCSRLIVRTPSEDFILPRRAPSDGESVAAYLFCRKSLLPGEAFIQSSNLLAPRSLLSKVPFRNEQMKWEDIDWVLRAATVPGAGLQFIPETLSIYYADDTMRRTMTGDRDWKYLFEWVTQNQDLLSARAYAGALLTSIAHEAAQEKDTRAVLPLLKEAVRRGQPTAIHLASFAMIWLAQWGLPHPLRSRIRHLLQRIGSKN